MPNSLRVTQIQDLSGTPVSLAPRNCTVFTASGYYAIPVGCNSVLVQVTGGGGGSCGYGESGGSGGYSEMIINTIGVVSVQITIGVGGALSTYANPSGNGGTSSFGTYCSATGGYGANTTMHCGGGGGTGSGGMLNINGGSGSGHQGQVHDTAAFGGASYWGGATSQVRNWATGGNSPPPMGVGAPGSGAPGSRGPVANHAGSGLQGLIGTNGMVVVWEYN